MTLIRAFTGPSRLTEDQVEWVEDKINELMDVPNEVRTGCADGLDTIAAGLQWGEYPRIKHRLFVPSAYHNERFVNYMSKTAGTNVEVIRCPRKTQRAEAYRVRNEYMVLGQMPSALPVDVVKFEVLPPVTKLEAFSFHPTFYRSGEWMTINIAFKAQIDFTVHVIPS